MANPRNAAAAFIILYISTFFMSHVQVEAISCGEVTNYMTPCFGYLLGGNLSPSCCAGVQNLNNAAATTADRQQTCQCLKDAANRFAGSINTGLASSLPSQCGVNIPYEISPDTDCTQIQFVG